MVIGLKNEYFNERVTEFAGSRPMHGSQYRPERVARALARRRDAAQAARGAGEYGPWRKETFLLPREEARRKAREWFERYPKAAYMTEIESWRIIDRGTEGERIEFTIRRLPSAD